MNTQMLVRLFVGVLFAGVVGQAFGATAPAIRVETAYDHKEGSYYARQPVTFTVTVKDEAGARLTKGVVTAVLDDYGTNVVLAATNFDLAAANPFKVTGKLDKPGFLRLKLKAPGIDGFPQNRGDGWYAESVDSGASQLRPSVPMPGDFAAFWKDAIAKYNREFTAAPELKLDEKLSDATWNVWRLTVDVPHGRKLYAFFTKEKNAPAGRLPARFQISAAGYGGWSQSPAKVPGHVSVFVTVYPFEPDPALGKKADYDALNELAKKEWNVATYSRMGLWKSCEDSFFYPVILGSLRLIDWLAAREDVDPMRLTYTGTSQGGGLGFAVTALSKRIRRAALFVPALTGHYGYKDGLESGWPKFVDSAADDVQRAGFEKNAAYYDGVNFARLIKVPVRVVAGYSDATCPPAMVRTAFNQIDCYDKAFEGGLRMTHSVYGPLYAKYEKWLDEVPETEALWPAGKTPEAHDFQTPAEIEWFAPTARVTKACVIVAPGGGYGGLAVPHEGYRTARNFLSRGVHVVLLRYRVPSPSAPEVPGQFWRSAWQDAQRCVRVIRSQAKARGIDPEKIGMTGFSAGGHLTCYTALNSLTPAYEPVDEIDKLPCHLNFAIPVYPAYLLKYPSIRLPKRGDEVDCPLIDQFAFDAKTPPMCFIHGDDDGHSAIGSIRIYERLRKMGIRADLHIYAGVNHAFGGSVRGGWRPCGWELEACNFAAAIGMMPTYNAVRWPDEK